MQEATGTIVRAVYDALKRPTSVWVGTNDTTGNGQEWSPTNQGTANLLDVTDYVYDNGGSGDSNLTEQIDHTQTSSQPDRATLYQYDWQDRLVAEKDGALLNSDGTNNTTGEVNTNVHRPIFVYTLDNLGEVTEMDQYDGDGVSLSTSPSSTLLRGKVLDQYDSQGRLYQRLRYSVDASGNVGGFLASNYYRDDNGNVIADYEPGQPARKTQYDAAGRDIADYTTDGGALHEGSSYYAQQPDWAAASSVTNDVVVQETDRTYDGSDNVVETIDRQRFDNDATSAVGPLGTPTTGVAARAYYAGNWYDLANRPTDTLDLGTDHGSVWTWSSTPPNVSSDTQHWTHWTYGLNGFQNTSTDPRGIVTNITTDALGRVSQTVSDPSGIAQATSFTYDGIDDLLTQNAINGPSHQKTQYNYAVSGTGTINSFDLLSSIQFPDKSTGDPGTASTDKASYGYDAQGDVTGFTDQNGTVHAYTYDPLMRLTLDSVSTFGTGIDQTVKSLGFSFDGAGRPYQQTSKQPNGTVLNQAEELYNGFSQIVTSYQEHAGAVNTGTSAKVQYAWTGGVGNASNLVGITDPNGQAIDRFYGSQVSLSGITASGTTATATTSQPLPAGLSVGTPVTISGASPTTYDGIFSVVSIIDSTHFTYTMGGTPTVSSASGNDLTLDVVPQVAIRSITYTNDGTNTTATVTTAQPHGLSNGGSVTIAGASQSAANGTVSSVGVTDSTHFSFTIGGKTLTGSDSGADIVAINPAILTVDSEISRVTGLEDHATSSPAVAGNILEGYAYLGLGTIVQRNRPQAKSMLTYIQQPGDTLASSDGGDRYTGLDRFGQVIDQYWLNPVTNTATDRFQSWYDRGGNVLYKNNLVNGAFSELYHPSGGADSSGYDNLNRVTSFSRGTLTHTNSANVDPSGRGLADTVATPSKTQGWTLDAQGNWTSFSTNGTAQTRAFNTRNQITSISGATIPTYDSNGNTTTDDQGKKYKFDAWNRLAEVDNGAGSALEYLRYLADGSRGAATTTDPCNGGTTDSYYSIDARDLEDKFTLPPHGCCGGSTTISTYAWGQGYENALISRDQGTTRLYAQQDANWDVTSLVGTNGAVAQRIDYDPYGSATFLNPNWTNGSNSNNWLYTWQGGKLDTIDGLLHFGTPGRDYSTTLGRWMEIDAALYIDGPNAYQAMHSNPATMVDPRGTAPEESADDSEPPDAEANGISPSQWTDLELHRNGRSDAELEQEFRDRQGLESETEREAREANEEARAKEGEERAQGGQQRLNDSNDAKRDKEMNLPGGTSAAARKAFDQSIMDALDAKERADNGEDPCDDGPWKPGEDIYKPSNRGTPPSDRTIGRRFWKNEAKDPSRKDYTPEDLARMEEGEPPQRYNAKKGDLESMERSHEPTPKRDGGTDMVPRWPEEHEQVDPYRRPGY